jgi:hypothetical protein
LGRGAFVADYNRAVAAHADNRAIDFVLVFKGLMLAPATLATFRRAGAASYCLYPDVSFLDHGPEIWNSLPIYDCVFTTKSFHLEDAQLRSRVRNLRLVSHGYDPEVHHPPLLSDAMRREYTCDVSFVGCWSPKKERQLGGLIAANSTLDVRIYGTGWERASEAVRARWRRRGAFGDELAIVYAASRINLGLLSEAGGGTTVGDQTTARTWQIPASGGLLLHEATAELERYFAPGREVAVFTSEADLPEVVARLLRSDSERAAIAAAGHRRCVDSEYTYDLAARDILAYHSAASRRG